VAKKKETLEERIAKQQARAELYKKQIDILVGKEAALAEEARRAKKIKETLSSKLESNLREVASHRNYGLSKLPSSKPSNAQPHFRAMVTVRENGIAYFPATRKAIKMHKEADASYKSVHDRLERLKSNHSSVLSSLTVLTAKKEKEDQAKAQEIKAPE
jgi:predicted nuclease with TOPRIM domain